MTSHPVDLEALERLVRENNALSKGEIEALLAEVRAARQAKDAWCEVRWEIVKMTAGNPDAVKWFRQHVALIDAALASPSVPPPQEKCNYEERAMLASGESIYCVKPLGHEGNHGYRFADPPAPPVLEEKAAQEAGEETAAPKEGGGAAAFVAKLPRAPDVDFEIEPPAVSQQPGTAPALPKEEVAPLTEREIAFRRKAKERAAIAHNPKPVKVDTRPRCKAITRRHHACAQAAYTVDGLCGSHATSMWNRYAKQKAAPVPLPEEQLSGEGGGLREALEDMLATVAPDDFSESCLLCGTRGEPNCCHEVIAARAALASVKPPAGPHEGPAAAPAPGDADRAVRLLIELDRLSGTDAKQYLVMVHDARVRSEEREACAKEADKELGDGSKIASRIRARASDATSAGGGE